MSATFDPTRRSTSARAIGTSVMIAASVLATAPLISCGSARRGAPFVGERHPTDAKLALGEQVFDRNCSQCHPGGEAGLGPALNNKPLPQFAVHFQVRNGVGAMPRIASAEISDQQLAAVTAYMVWLRKQRR